MAEQNRAGAESVGQLVQRLIAGRARGRLRSPVAAHDHADGLDRVEAALPQQPDHLLGAARRALLQPVVHRHGPAPQPEPRRDERPGAGQRQRVGTARAGDQHQVPGLVVLQRMAYRQAYRRYRGYRSHR